MDIEGFSPVPLLDAKQTHDLFLLQQPAWIFGHIERDSRSAKARFVQDGERPLN